MEAMAAGLVVVGTDTGGSPEIFSHFDENLLFLPGDARALAERLTRLIGDDTSCGAAWRSAGETWPRRTSRSTAW